MRMMLMKIMMIIMLAMRMMMVMILMKHLTCGSIKDVDFLLHFHLVIAVPSAE
jgi:hypothetical protein